MSRDWVSLRVSQVAFLLPVLHTRPRRGHPPLLDLLLPLVSEQVLWGLWAGPETEVSVFLLRNPLCSLQGAPLPVRLPQGQLTYKTNSPSVSYPTVLRVAGNTPTETPQRKHLATSKLDTTVKGSKGPQK